MKLFRSKSPKPKDDTDHGRPTDHHATLDRALRELRGAMEKAPSDLALVEPPYGVTPKTWRQSTAAELTGRRLLVLAAWQPLVEFANPNSPNHEQIVTEFSKADLLVVSREILNEASARLALVADGGRAHTLLCQAVLQGESILVADGTKLLKLIVDAEVVATAIETTARQSNGRVTVLHRLGVLSGAAPVRPSLKRSEDFIHKSAPFSADDEERSAVPQFPEPKFTPDVSTGRGGFRSTSSR